MADYGCYCRIVYCLGRGACPCTCHARKEEEEAQD